MIAGNRYPEMEPEYRFWKVSIHGPVYISLASLHPRYPYWSYNSPIKTIDSKEIQVHPPGKLGPVRAHAVVVARNLKE